MLRLIVTTSDVAPAIYAGGEVLRSSKTFDVDLPELEEALRKGNSNVPNHEMITSSLSYELR